MFVFLSKFLPPLFYPLGLTILLTLLAFLARNRPRLRNLALSTALVVILAASNAAVAQGLARSLEWRYLPEGEIPNAAAIVVLGGGTNPASAPRPMVETNSAGDRVLYAAKLYQAGKAPVILASGGSITWLDNRPSTPAEEMGEILKLVGVPQEAIWLQTSSQNTYEDALYSAAMLKEKGIDRVILVTSAMHMPRSVALFEKQGIQVIPAPVDFAVTRQEARPLTWATLPSYLVDLLPSAGSLNLTTNALKEYIGMLAYWLRGWL